MADPYNKDIRGTNDVLSQDILRLQIQPVAKKFGLEKIYLFGSYARNEATADSDVDFLIEGGNYHGLFEFMNIVEEFKKATGKEVDVVHRDAVFDTSTKSGQRFQKSIEEEKVLLYG